MVEFFLGTAIKSKKDKFKNQYVEKEVRKIFEKYFSEYVNTLKNVKVKK